MPMMMVEGRDPTIEELAERVRKGMDQYAKDYALLEYCDYEGHNGCSWCSVGFSDPGEALPFCIQWGIEEEAEEPFAYAETIRDCLLEALREIEATHKVAEDRRKEIAEDD